MNRSEKLTLIIITGIVIAAALFTLGRVSGPGDTTGTTAAAVAERTPLSVSSYTDRAGQPVDLTAYAGRVRVVNSWASWCPFCTEELPDLATLADSYDQAEVVVVAINRKESAATVNAYLDSIAFAEDSNLQIVLDPEDAFYRSIGGFTMPETIFYAADGQVVLHKRGFMTLEEMQGHVADAVTHGQSQ